MRIVYLLLPVLFIALPSKALTLKECYALALERSEDLAAEQETLNQTEEQLSQAKGAFLPNVTGSYSFLRQQTPPGALSNLYRSSQTTAKISAVQPLFQGFREYASLKQSNRRVESSELKKDNAKILIFHDVVQTFYQVLLLEQDLKNLENEISVNQKRYQELLGFRKIGRSRQTEVLTVEANIATLEAQQDSLKGQLETARSALAYLTGQNKEVPLQDKERAPEQLQTMEYYLSKIEQRPDVKAAKKVSEATEQGIAIARGGHFPTIDLLGNYYFRRPGSLNEVHWDLQLALTFPLFAGGIVQSQVREAASAAKQGELQVSKTKRQALQQVESLYALTKSDLSQLHKQKKATELAVKNYQAELKDYRFGLVTNIEVLQAMNVSQSNQRILDRTLFQLKSDYLRLQASVAPESKEMENKP